MADTFLEVSAGQGTKLRTLTRSIGGSTVHEESVIPGDSHMPSYMTPGSSISVATVDTHLLQVMAGASLKLRIRRIVVVANAATIATTGAFQILRLTTAGTGGTALTPSPLDTTDPASGATAMAAVATVGTEGAVLLRFSLGFPAAPPHGAVFEWVQSPNQKPIIVPAGAANGIVLKNLVAIAGGGINTWIEFDETSF